MERDTRTSQGVDGPLLKVSSDGLTGFRNLFSRHLDTIVWSLFSDNKGAGVQAELPGVWSGVCLVKHVRVLRYLQGPADAPFISRLKLEQNQIPEFPEHTELYLFTGCLCAREDGVMVPVHSVDTKPPDTYPRKFLRVSGGILLSVPEREPVSLESIWESLSMKTKKVKKMEDEAVVPSAEPLEVVRPPKQVKNENVRKVETQESPEESEFEEAGPKGPSMNIPDFLKEKKGVKQETKENPDNPPWDGPQEGSAPVAVSGEDLPPGRTVCVACEGTGVNSKGSKCAPCAGNGHVQEEEEENTHPGTEPEPESESEPESEPESESESEPESEPESEVNKTERKESMSQDKAETKQDPVKKKKRRSKEEIIRDKISDLEEMGYDVSMKDYSEASPEDIDHRINKLMDQIIELQAVLVQKASEQSMPTDPAELLDLVKEQLK